MATLITYDTNINQQQVKNGMISLGYSDEWPGNNGPSYLPNTTLWKDTTPAQARDDLDSVVSKIPGTSVERVFACSINGWASKRGQKHS
jgi:hypothetical protein